VIFKKVFAMICLRRALLALSATLTLGACTSLPVTVFEGRYAMRDGWHRGTVERVLPTRDLPAVLVPACVPPAPGAGLWAVVAYRPAGSPRQTVVPVVDAAAWAAGTPVYVRVGPCEREIAARRAEP